MYQSSRLATYADRLIHGFTGKPLLLGGPPEAADTVHQDRQALCSRAGLNAQRLVLPRQTHSACHRLNDSPADMAADAVIVSEPEVPAMVQVADCVPVLLYAPDRHIGAAVHAGWRGTAQAITARVATVLIEEYQADPARLVAAIGPAISGCCYEVSLEVAEAVGQSLREPSPAWSRVNGAGRPVIDLKAVNRLQLEALGVGQIDVLPDCTRCQPNDLWSYRRAEVGRQVGFLQLLPR